MTVTVTREQLYLGVIVLLCILQILQWVAIKKLQRECESLWTQVAALVSGVSNQIISIQKDLNNKEDKK